MVDRIEQQFIVEADRALQELNRLEAGFAKARRQIGGLSRALKTYNARASQAVDITRSLSATLPAVGKGLAQINSNTQKFGRSIDKTRDLETNLRNAFRGTKQLEKGLKGASKGAQQLTISFETFARIIATQIIVRTIGAITRGLSDSVDQAIELQKQIALIQTITPDAGILQISQAVRDISDEFNLDIVETAAGLYNTLSNQVGSFGDSLLFATDAARFAKATNSTLADSVDLLSGVLKAFGLTAADTADIAAKLFVGIDRGRVTADELANTLGRVLEPASALSISFEELVGGIAEITVKGTNASESLTQFRGIINALTKPTPALTKAIKELGFATTEAAIQALGLPGVLDALVKSTDGTQEALAKLFPRVRGVGGVLSLTSENLAGFRKTVEEANKATDEFAESKFFIATATDAETVTKALNRLSNVITEDIGNLIVRRGAELAEFAGGLENVGTIAVGVVPALESLVFTLGSLLTVVALIKFTAFIGAGGIIGGVAIAAIALTAAFVGLRAAAEDARIQNIEDQIRAAGDAAGAELKAVKEKNRDILKAEREKNREILSETQKLIARVNIAQRAQINDAVTRDKALVSNIKSRLQEVLITRGRILSELAATVAGTAQLIEDSDKLVAKVVERQAERDIASRESGLPERVKILNLIRRSTERNTTAIKDFNTATLAGSKQGVIDARREIERSQRDIDSARSRGIAIKDKGVIALAEKRASEFSAAQVRSQNALRDRSEEELDNNKKKLSTERGLNAELKERVANAGKLVSLRSEETGELLPKATRDKRGEELRREIDAIAALAGQNLNEVAAAGAADLVTQINSILTENPAQIKFDLAEAQKDLLAAEFTILARVKAVFPGFDAVQDAAGRELTSGSQFGQALGEQQAERERLLALETSTVEQAIAKRATEDRITEAIARQKILLEDTLKLQKQAGQRRLVPGLFGEGPQLEPAAQAEARARKVGAEAQATRLLIAGLEDLRRTGSVEQLQDNLSLVTDLTKTAGTEFVTLSREIKGALALIQEFQNFGKGATQITAKQTTRLRELSGLPDQPFGSAGQSIQEAKQASDKLLQNFQSTDIVAASIENHIKRAVPAGIPNVVGGINNPFITTPFAGIARLASGGFTGKGTDTIPALLSRGESIINARDSQRFFSQIQSFNAGGNPVSRVGDNNVAISTGDINVNGAQNPTATAREIDRSLNRLARRGNSRALRRQRR